MYEYFYLATIILFSWNFGISYECQIFIGPPCARLYWLQMKLFPFEKDWKMCAKAKPTELCETNKRIVIVQTNETKFPKQMDSITDVVMPVYICPKIGQF